MGYKTYKIGDGPLVNLSEDFITLSARKRELDSVPFSSPEADREIMAESYECLANEFEQEACYMMAEACHRAADGWRK